MKLFKPSTWFKTTPQPIQINPGNAATLARHVGRLANLYAAKRKEPRRADVLAEIEQRKMAIANYGHTPPADEDKARALLARLRGE